MAGRGEPYPTSSAPSHSVDPVSSPDLLDVEVRSEEALTPAEHASLELAGLTFHAPAEAWTVLASNRQVGYSTHGLYRFFGKFPPPIARALIENYTEPGDLVVDPTCGSGTTAVEALLLDRECAVADVNPLGLLLARVKTRQIEAYVLRRASESVAHGYRPVPESEAPELVGLRNPTHWFRSSTADSLRGLRRQVLAEKDQAVRECLLAVFAATVREVSRATTQQGRLFLDVSTAKDDALAPFMRRAERAIKSVEELPPRWPSGVTTVAADLRTTTPDLVGAGAPLVIVHPPYFNGYRFTSTNSLELAWLGLDSRAIRRSEIREFFKVGRPENAIRYIDDMSACLANAARLAQPGGAVAVMIGDTTLRGDHIRIVRPLLERAPTSLQLEKIVVRVPRHTEASWVTSQRRTSDSIGVRMFDYILLFRQASPEWT